MYENNVTIESTEIHLSILYAKVLRWVVIILTIWKNSKIILIIKIFYQAKKANCRIYKDVFVKQPTIIFIDVTLFDFDFRIQSKNTEK